MTVAVDWVALLCRFTPGWPWPEDSFGLGPMFGDDGWCRGCGTPLVEQSGDLVMQGSKFPSAAVWMPNWLFDVVCVSGDVADDVAARFAVDLRGVRKPRSGLTRARQLVPALGDRPWYRPEDLADAARTRHGGTGATCERCGRWKWLPILAGEVAVDATALSSARDVVASPETFGDGLMSFRHLLFRRPLAEALVAASPRLWNIVEITVR